jgi:hypothetical protein
MRHDDFRTGANLEASSCRWRGIGRHLRAPGPRSIPSHDPMPSHRGRRCRGEDTTGRHQSTKPTTRVATLSNLLPVAAVCRTSTSQWPAPCSLLLAPGPAPSRQRCRCLPVGALSRPGRLSQKQVGRWLGGRGGNACFSHTAIWLQKKIRTGAVAVNSVKNATSQEQQLPRSFHTTAQSPSIPAFQCPVSVFLHTPSTEAPSPR